jgi:MarR family transcriptional regulator, lower aerobic nicotinate degradation pathway regulator
VTSRDHPQGELNVGGLGFLLDRLSHSLGRAFEPVLAPFDLRSTHLGVLTSVARFGPLSQSQLAAYLGIERQQMVNLVDHLVRAGLVVRTGDPADRRRLRITLTASGRRVRKEAVAAARRHEQTAFGGLSPDEQEQLTGLLLRLVPSGHFARLFAEPRSPDPGSR